MAHEAPPAYLPSFISLLFPTHTGNLGSSFMEMSLLDLIPTLTPTPLRLNSGMNLVITYLLTGTIFKALHFPWSHKSGLRTLLDTPALLCGLHHFHTLGLVQGQAHCWNMCWIKDCQEAGCWVIRWGAQAVSRLPCRRDDNETDLWKSWFANFQLIEKWKSCKVWWVLSVAREKKKTCGENPQGKNLSGAYSRT